MAFDLYLERQHRQKPESVNGAAGFWLFRFKVERFSRRTTQRARIPTACTT